MTAEGKGIFAGAAKNPTLQIVTTSFRAKMPAIGAIRLLALSDGN
jgi:hypothetical protein